MSFLCSRGMKFLVLCSFFLSINLFSMKNEEKEHFDKLEKRNQELKEIFKKRTAGSKIKIKKRIKRILGDIVGNRDRRNLTASDSIYCNLEYGDFVAYKYIDSEECKKLIYAMILENNTTITESGIEYRYNIIIARNKDSITTIKTDSFSIYKIIFSD